MMRLIAAVWWLLALFWLWSTQLGAQQDGKAKAVPPSRVRVAWPEVRGYGLTTSDAAQDARQQALKEAEAFLLRQKPPLAFWKPAPQDLDTYFLQDSGFEGPEVDLEIPEAPNKMFKSWILTFRSNLNLHALQRFDQFAHSQQIMVEQQQRSHERLRSLTRFMAVVLISLAAFVGYGRLDEWTAGRYRRLLQAALGGVLLAALAGWWWQGF